jgi:hypothetical protein
MGLPRPPGLPSFSALRSWVVRAINSKLGRADHQPQAARPSAPRHHARTLSTTALGHKPPRPTIPKHSLRLQARQYSQFQFPRFAKGFPKFPRIKFTPTSYLLRPQVGAFPRRAWGQPAGSSASHFHTSPASAAIALNQIAHSVSSALRSGVHPDSTPVASVKAQIAALVAAKAAAQTTDGPAGYIRFTLSPPAWTPTETDLSDPDIVKAIDTQIAELRRVKAALVRLRKYGDFPIRATLPDVEAKIDVLFRGATAEDVARWNANEFKLASGLVGADTMFCAGRFEEFVRWSEVLDVERRVDREMLARNKNEVLKFWEELDLLEGRIH